MGSILTPSHNYSTRLQVVGWILSLKFGKYTTEYAARFKEAGFEGSDLLEMMTMNEKGVASSLREFGIVNTLHHTKLLHELEQVAK